MYHNEQLISIPFKWLAEGARNTGLRIRDTTRFLRKGLGILEPVIYMHQQYQVIEGEFKAVSFFSITFFFMFAFVYSCYFIVIG